MRFIYLFPLFFWGCAYQPITVQTEYINHESLASYHVGTPDSMLHSPLVGQRLIISWSIPACDMSNSARLHLKVRFRNREEEEKVIELKRRFGTYLYQLEGSRYCETEGILTYKIEIRNNDRTITQWKHQLWSELIYIDALSSHLENSDE